MKRKRIYKSKTFWKKHVSLWEKSNLSQAEYCREHNLLATTFSNWKYKFMKQSESLELVPVALPLEQSVGAKCKNGSGFYFDIGGHRLEIENDFDPVTFTSILKCLEQI